MASDIHNVTEDDHHRFVTAAEAKFLAQQAAAEALANLSRAPRPFKVFALDASKKYGEKVAAHLGRTLTPHNEKLFEDGECYVKPVSDAIGNVRGHNVFVVQSLYSDDLAVMPTFLRNLGIDFMPGRQPEDGKVVNEFMDYLLDHAGETAPDKLMKLEVMCGALRDASAHEITAIIPHLAWARQDRKTESRAPITTKYLAMKLEAVGVDRALFIDVHNLSAIQNAFRMPIDNLETRNLHAEHCARELKAADSVKIRVLTPDAGGLSRGMRFRNSLARILGLDFADDIEMCIFDKVRSKGKVIGGRIIGDVDGADVIAYDDLISTATTMKKACKTTIESGGNLFAICAAHGQFCGNANEAMKDFDTRFVIADTIEPFRLSASNRAKVYLIDTTKMVADAIVRIHSGTGSISELLE